MRSLFLAATLVALAWARPETYKETEDFQYARSSSDEGSKSGFYGAQRGNMGGNYEKAHNMDALAQNQMSGAVNQVEGELGDASKTRTGSVYTAANSRGIYGSGRYDLSNLQGRNFAESYSADSAHSHSSLLSAYNQHSQNSDWRSQSQQSTGFGASDQYAQSTLHSGNLQAADSTTTGTYNRGLTNSGSHYGYNSGYQSQSGYHAQSGYHGASGYDQSSLNLPTYSKTQAGDQAQSRYIITPVRIVTRPGVQIAVPVYARGYDTQAASTFDHNALTSEAEVLNNNQQQVHSVPQGNAKHYESAYSYKKAWERHSDVSPTIVPTLAPVPKNSELYEDAQVASGSDSLQQANYHGSHSSNAYNNQNSYAHSGATQSRHQSDYSAQHASLTNLHHRSETDSSSNAHMQGTHGSLAGLTGSSSLGVDSQPKSYQSSYSYHKSWERQGDPYVIVPPTQGGVSTGNTKSAAYSQQYGSQYRQSQHHHSQGSTLDCDCDEDGHVRGKRSYHTGGFQEDLQQQAQNAWDEDLGQQTQTKWDRLEEGQQAQSNWDLESHGQKEQQSWTNTQQLNQPEKLEDVGQQTQQTWGQAEQQEDLEQQSQHTWGNNLHQNKPEKLEDLGQHTLQTENQLHKTEDLSQQSQQTFDNFDDLGQQTQSKFDDLESLGQQVQHTWSRPDSTTPEDIQELGQKTQNKWDNIENLGQVQTQWHDISKTHFDTTNTEQQTQTQSQSVDRIKHNNEKGEFDIGTQHTAENTDSVFSDENSYLNNPRHPSFWSTNDARIQNNFYQHHHNYNFTSYSQRDGASWQMNTNDVRPTSNNPLQSLWDKIDDLEEQSEHSPNDKDQSSTGLTDNFYFGQSNTHHYESNSGYASNSYNHNQYQTHFTENQPSIVVNRTDLARNKSKTEQDRDKNIFEESSDKDVIDKEEPSEVGRGDIGADGDNLEHKTTEKSAPVLNYFLTGTKPEKTPEEIEALSLSLGTDEDKSISKNQSDPLSVLSITQQKWLEDQKQRAFNGLVNKTRPTFNTSTISEQSQNLNQKNLQQSQNSGRLSENTNQQNAGQQLEDFGQLSQNLDQQNLEQFGNVGHYSNSAEQQNAGQQLEDFGQQSQTLNQQNVGKELEDFGQQTQDLQHQNLEQFQSLGHYSQNAEQINVGKKLEDFGQQTQNPNQQNLQQIENASQFSHSTAQQNAGQLEEFRQQSQGLQQQNLEQLGNLGHSSYSTDKENAGQQLEDFGQQTQDLTQQNIDQFQSSGHYSQNMNHQNSGQQLEDFGQQSQDLHQQNLEQFGNLGHFGQNMDQQNAGQQLEDFGQQSHDLHQQNLEQFGNLGHYSQSTDKQNAGQQLEDFGQQTQDLTQQNNDQFQSSGHYSQNMPHRNSGQQLEDFGQQSQDLNQQNLEPFGNLGQYTQSTDQKNAGQQLEDFGQDTQDLNQQNLQQFSKVDQQSQNLNQELDDLNQIKHNQNAYNHDHQARSFDSNPQAEVQEPEIIAVNIPDSQSVPKQVVEAPPPVVTEKPGFWKSVGNKFTSAKDSVASWFKRS